jgi:hypothetical protein
MTTKHRLGDRRAAAVRQVRGRRRADLLDVDTTRAELATDVPGTDLDPGLVLSEALRRLGDVEGADRQRRGFVERQDELTVREEEEALP